MHSVSSYFAAANSPLIRGTVRIGLTNNEILVPREHLPVHARVVRRVTACIETLTGLAPAIIITDCQFRLVCGSGARPNGFPSREDTHKASAAWWLFAKRSGE